MSRICVWSIWNLVNGTPSLDHVCTLVCLNVLISVLLGHHLVCSLTSLLYPSYQACGLNVYLRLDSASTCRMVFPFTYIMLKSNAMILITHLKVLDDVTLSNSFLGLNKDSRGLWSDLKRDFLPNKKFCALSVLQTMANASFSMLE